MRSWANCLPTKRSRIRVAAGVGICISVLAGCAPRQAAEVASLPKLDAHDGVVTLGTPALLGGIPGSGPLTHSEIEAWIAFPEVHEPLAVALPSHLVDDVHRMSVPDDNPLTWAKIELGRQLFFDKRLSGLGTFSCATCHPPSMWFTSHMVMPEVGRNASAVFNRILGEEHFWDGRAQGLENQPLSPIENPFEMNSTPEKSAANIRSIKGYRLQFDRIFGGVSFAAICQALACFQRAIVTPESPWDRGELSPAAIRGQELFYSERLGCGDCHVGKNLTDESYHRLGAHQLRNYGDPGRFEATKNAVDRFAFKTPSLRNVAMTAPYMHNGAIGTLEQVIEFFDVGGPRQATETTLEPLKLNEQEKLDLIAFFNALTSDVPPIETGRLPE